MIGVFLPYLLLTNGKYSFPRAFKGNLTLAELSEEPRMDFHGIELLTLSGCQTGMSTRSDGREIDGLGFAAKDKGAKAVMATLWEVKDPSTALLMETSYRLTSGTSTDSSQTSKGRRLANSATRTSALLASPVSANVRAAEYARSGLREIAKAAVASFSQPQPDGQRLTEFCLTPIPNNRKEGRVRNQEPHGGAMPATATSRSAYAPTPQPPSALKSLPST